jgi:hypothetical protein
VLDTAPGAAGTVGTVGTTGTTGATGVVGGADGVRPRGAKAAKAARDAAAAAAATFGDDPASRFEQTRSVPGADRVGGASSLRVDGQRTLVMSQGRAYIGVAATELNAVGAAVARGSVALLQGNSLQARGATPVLLAVANADMMVNHNRMELRGSDGTTAVLLSTPVLVLNANRVRHFGPAIRVVSANTVVAAVGNITTGSISIGGVGLPAPWAALNLNA